MKAFFTTLLAIICMGVLLWGNIYWTKKTTVSGESSETPIVSEKKNVEEKTSEPSDTLLELTKKWPEQSVENFNKALSDGRPFKVLLVGSTALGDEQSGWAAQTKEQLVTAYGKDHMNVEIQVFDQTSREFTNEGGAEKVANAQADMVLFEPFTLMDNGEVAIEDSLNNIQTVMDGTLKANPNTVFILMPPHPIYNATFYPKQVDALKEYAAENNISYLDHWEAWPDYSSEDVKEYVSPDNSQPSEKGHELWSKYVTEYLISK